MNGPPGQTPWGQAYNTGHQPVSYGQTSYGFSFAFFSCSPPMDR